MYTLYSLSSLSSLSIGSSAVECTARQLDILIILSPVQNCPSIPNFTPVFQVIPPVFQVIPLCSKLYPCVPSYTPVFQVIPPCSKLYPLYSKLYPRVPSYTSMFQVIPLCSKLYPRVPSYTPVFHHRYSKTVFQYLLPSVPNPPHPLCSTLHHLIPTV